MEPLTGLEHLGRVAAAEQDRLADGIADLETEKRRFVAASAPKRPSRVVVWLAAAAMLSALCAALLTLRNGRNAAPLAFRVGEAGLVGEADAWLASPPDAPLALGFSDGTSVTLEPSARARVTKVGPMGATVLVERGRGRFSVIKRSGAAWRVSLGPFRVDVTGTRFDVGWDPRSENLTLDMHEGSVVVSGCVFGAGRPFAAGESVRASCQDQHVEISKKPAGPSATRSTQPSEEVVDDRPPPPVDQEAAGVGSSSTAERHGSEPGQSGAARSVAAGSSWRDLVRAGRHGEALDAVEAVGFSAECATASAADLVSLGDAGRYVGRLERATEAYETVRRRFPGNERSAVAAFALGRIAFDQRRSYADAARWFRTYLVEQPGGRLARDALGRLVEAFQRAGDTTSARREAARYLELYPTGPHADFARRVMGE